MSGERGTGRGCLVKVLGDCNVQSWETFGGHDPHPQLGLVDKNRESLNRWFPNLSKHQSLLEGWVQIPGPSCWCSRSGVRPENVHSNTFPGDADAAGAGTPLGSLLHQRGF